MNTKTNLKSCWCILAVLAGWASASVGLSGCREKDKTEKVIDIDTPDTDIEVERSKTDGSLKIKVKRKKTE